MVHADGLHRHVVLEGHGLPVVLIAGFPQSCYAYRCGDLPYRRTPVVERLGSLGPDPSNAKSEVITVHPVP